MNSTERYRNDPEYRERHLEYARERYRNDPEYRERALEYARESESCRELREYIRRRTRKRTARINALIPLGRAGEPWTPVEDADAVDPGLSEIAVAFKWGRTPNAVNSRRRLLRRMLNEGADDEQQSSKTA